MVFWLWTLKKQLRLVLPVRKHLCLALDGHVDSQAHSSSNICFVQPTSTSDQWLRTDTRPSSVPEPWLMSVDQLQLSNLFHDGFIGFHACTSQSDWSQAWLITIHVLELFRSERSSYGVYQKWVPLRTRSIFPNWNMVGNAPSALICCGWFKHISTVSDIHKPFTF
jgi:hypothetical protein